MAIATATSMYLIDVAANNLLDITPTSGLNTADTYNIGPGYGQNIYGQGYDYGSSAGLSGLLLAYTDYARWSLDNWGDYLIAMKEADGKIWVFDPVLSYDTANQQSDTVNTTENSNEIYTGDHTKYTLKASVVGAGIPQNAVVTAIDTNLTGNGYAITLSGAATATATSVTVSIAEQNLLEHITTDSDPLRARGLIVTAERHLLLYGSEDIPRRIRWSASEDYTVWTSTTQNPTEAGSLEVSTKGFLMACKKVRAGTLIFSSVDVHLLQYLGPPYIYGIESLAEACGPVSSACIQQVAERTVWLATDGFWQYDGQVGPLPCAILEKFLEDIDMQRGGLVAAGAIREYGEVIWFYCSKDNSNDRCNKYILWGTRNNTWSLGTLSRDSFQEEEAYVFPVATGPDSNGDTYIWAHEVDRSLADDPNVLTYAETGVYEIMQGERLARVTKIWHDLARNSAAGNYPQFKFYTSASADSTETERGPFSPQADGSIDVRFQGKQLRLLVQAPISEEWTLGKQRLEILPGGTR